jgi:hypothetical protein
MNDPIIEDEPDVDSTAFDYPTYPLANYASDMFNGYQADMERESAYRAFQE